MELERCGQPWFELQIEYNGKVGCCCYYRFKKDRFNDPFHVDAYWNGEKFQELRGVIASNSAAGTGCEGCQYIKYVSPSDFTAIPEALNQLQLDNWKRALRNYEEKKRVVDSYPVKYYMNFGLACNLNCIMCCQADDRKTDKRQLPVEPLLELKEYFLQANEIAIIGGEPLALPNARKFIETITRDPDYSNVKLSVFTNGTLLHNYTEAFRNIRRLGICVSLDSIGDAYEHIRGGARWADTEKNIMTFKEVGDKHGLDWSVNIAAVVMKSSIPRLVEFVDWCIENNTMVHFVPMNSQSFTEDEDLFRHPQFLNSIPGWEQKIDTAVEKLESKGWIVNGANPLKMIKSELKSRELNLQGEELFTGGDIQGALALFSESVERDSSYAVPLNNLGVVCWNSGEVSRALKYFLKAFRIDPYNRDTVLNCGRIMAELGQYEDAGKLYQSYLYLFPKDRIIARAYLEMQEVECNN
jgi:sulfatase maturation enzyme AslB (radical SAM superfamily)